MTRSENETEQRVRALRTFVAGEDVVPILIQRDPDPDGMASALGLRAILGGTEHSMPIVSLGEVTRAENRRLAELLDIRVTRVTEAELQGFRRVITVDTQPIPGGAGSTRYAVIDHHPPRHGYSPDLLDIRPDIGAAATMVTQYLRAAHGTAITPRLATALLYGIRTDTDVLRRGTSGADIEAYAFLQGLADAELLAKIGRPAFTEAAVAAMGEAMAALGRQRDVAVVYLGGLDDSTAHALPTIADFCLAIEGVTWSAAGGRLGEDLVLALRRAGAGPGAGDLARVLAERDGTGRGQGGGHQSMARVSLPAGGGLALSDRPGDRPSTARLLEWVAGGVEAVRSLRSGRASAASDGRTGWPPSPVPGSATAAPRPSGRTGW